MAEEYKYWVVAEEGEPYSSVAYPELTAALAAESYAELEIPFSFDPHSVTLFVAPVGPDGITPDESKARKFRVDIEVEVICEAHELENNDGT